ncbi:MAG: WD40 repeat domain-containing protein [Gemmataceae bacterium]
MVARVYTSDGRLEEAAAHDGPVTAVAFAADGRRVWTGSDDKTVMLAADARLAGAARRRGAAGGGQPARRSRAVGRCRRRSAAWNLTDGKPAGVIALTPARSPG